MAVNMISTCDEEGESASKGVLVVIQSSLREPIGMGDLIVLDVATAARVDPERRDLLVLDVLHSRRSAKFSMQPARAQCSKKSKRPPERKRTENERWSPHGMARIAHGVGPMSSLRLQRKLGRTWRWKVRAHARRRGRAVCLRLAAPASAAWRAQVVKWEPRLTKYWVRPPPVGK